MQKNTGDFWAGAPYTHTHTSTHLCTPQARTGVFGYLGVFGMCNAIKNTGSFCGGAPYTHTSAHRGPEKVVLDTWDGGVSNGQCQFFVWVLGRPKHCGSLGGRGGWTPIVYVATASDDHDEPSRWNILAQWN